MRSPPLEGCHRSLGSLGDTAALGGGGRPWIPTSMSFLLRDPHRPEDLEGPGARAASSRRSWPVSAVGGGASDRKKKHTDPHPPPKPVPNPARNGVTEGPILGAGPPGLADCPLDCSILRRVWFVVRLQPTG